MTRMTILCSFAVVVMTACSGTTTFKGTAGSTIVGTAAAPPPAAPPPRVVVRDNQIQISEKIQFDDDKATIKPESDSLLDEIVATFQKNPQIKKVEVDGFASSEGDANHNKKLSDDRAKSVMAYLTSHGVDKSRLAAKGWGIEKPIADNSTEEGREANRRVEFNILAQDVTKQKVEVDPTTGKEKVVDSSTTEVKSNDTTTATTAAKGGSK